MVEVPDGKSILVVEDDEDVALTLKARLEGAGYTVHTEHYGGVALGYAAAHSLDLVILDLKLPDIDGYDVCRELRQMCEPVIPRIVMYTCLARPNDWLRGRASGADAYVTKISEPNELMLEVDRLLSQEVPD